MARTRLKADLRGAATELSELTGTAPPGRLSKERVAALDDAFADAAGVPVVVARSEVHGCAPVGPPGGRW